MPLQALLSFFIKPNIMNRSLYYFLHLFNPVTSLTLTFETGFLILIWAHVS